MKRIQKIKQVLSEHLVPEKALFGTVFVCKDTQEVWYATRSDDGQVEGPVLNLSQVLNGKPALAPVRHGKDGRDAVDGRPGRDGSSGPAGPRGDKGEVGASITGPAGRDGRDGKDCVCVNVDANGRLSRIEQKVSDVQHAVTAAAGKSAAATDAVIALIDAKVSDAKRAMTDLGNKQTAFATSRSVEDAGVRITELSQQVTELKFTVDALLDQNKRGADYVKYLQEKVRSKTCRT